MLMVGLIGGAVGVLLGLRYKVLVLIPVFFVVLAIVAIAAILGLDGPWRLASMLVVVVTSVQLGYLLGNAAVAAIGAIGSVWMLRRGDGRATPIR